MPRTHTCVFRDKDRDDSMEGWLVFREPKRFITAECPVDVPAALAALDDAVGAGDYVAGYVAYEAALGLDQAFRCQPPIEGLPLVWFAVYGSVLHVRDLPRADGASRAEGDDDYRFSEWQPAITREEYVEALDRIHGYIRAGDTYQVNFTHRLFADFEGDAFAFFANIYAAQRSARAAYVDTGDHAICSASPELFFSLSGNRLVSRPMKGTAARGCTWGEDLIMQDRLAESAKDRAENIMIVDMIRNDMGKLAVPGSVNVASCYDIERYSTVFQMTSTVESEWEASVSDVMQSLFPCASVTGAPKFRSMEIIRDLEGDARGIYTGCIGYITPDRHAEFNVAIRTVVIDRRSGRASYGVGGGIVWDSDPDSEFEECQTKARVLNERMHSFDLIETMRWDPDRGFFLFEEHMQRLFQSAAYFDFEFDEDQVQSVLRRVCDQLPREACRVRTLMGERGDVRVEYGPLCESQGPVSLGLAAVPVDKTVRYLYHKTSHREVYDAARASRPDCDDVLLWNEDGQLTESTFANVVIEKNGERLTPPVSSGLLNGTFRSHLVDSGKIREAVLTRDDLWSADNVFLINSVREWMEVRMADATPDSAG
jgi:para-aminobenzoate synthetase/4-amino-4-deoxychorismate lyase